MTRAGVQSAHCVSSGDRLRSGPNRSFVIASEDNNLINHKRFINICPQPPGPKMSPDGQCSFLIDVIFHNSAFCFHERISNTDFTLCSLSA